MTKNNEIQELWNQSVLNDFIRRMLIYYDPWMLKVLLAPDDEYDSYIPKVFHIIESKYPDAKSISDELGSLFLNTSIDQSYFTWKVKRMSEDIIEFLKDSR